jgi:hypothetical protein
MFLVIVRHCIVIKDLVSYFKFCNSLENVVEKI